jgi:acetoin utilization deacetylase AcuC-like enzyme
VLVAYDESLTRHLAGVPHAERPDRVRACAVELERRGMLGERIDVRVAELAPLVRVHDGAYVERAKRECERLDAASYALLSTGDTEIDASSYDGALRAAGGALAALDGIVAGDRAAFALVRPPGHHAEPARGMGFCLFNNAAVAARAFIDGTGLPALIADIDYHHGNGTQALVGDGLSYVSTHAMPAYPGTGAAADNHLAAGGALLNLPIAASGIVTEGFVALWATALRALAERIRPGLLVISAGYDFAAGDPVGDLGVAPAAAREIGRLAREIADAYCHGRALFVLEGGYDPAVLAHCVAETIAGYEEGVASDAADPAAIPAAQRALLARLAA